MLHQRGKYDFFATLKRPNAQSTHSPSPLSSTDQQPISMLPFFRGNLEFPIYLFSRWFRKWLLWSHFFAFSISLAVSSKHFINVNFSLWILSLSMFRFLILQSNANNGMKQGRKNGLVINILCITKVIVQHGPLDSTNRSPSLCALSQSRTGSGGMTGWKDTKKNPPSQVLFSFIIICTQKLFFRSFHTECDFMGWTSHST